MRNRDEALRESGNGKAEVRVKRRVANAKRKAVIGGALTACYTSKHPPAPHCCQRQGSPAGAPLFYDEAQVGAKCPSTF